MAGWAWEHPMKVQRIEIVRLMPDLGSIFRYLNLMQDLAEGDLTDEPTVALMENTLLRLADQVSRVRQELPLLSN